MAPKLVGNGDCCAIVTESRSFVGLVKLCYLHWRYAAQHGYNRNTATHKGDACAPPRQDAHREPKGTRVYARNDRAIARRTARGAATDAATQQSTPLEHTAQREM